MYTCNPEHHSVEHKEDSVTISMSCRPQRSHSREILWKEETERVFELFICLCQGACQLKEGAYPRYVGHKIPAGHF